MSNGHGDIRYLIGYCTCITMNIIIVPPMKERYY